MGIIWLEMHNPDINWVTKCIFFRYPEYQEHLLFLLGSLTVLPSGPKPTVAPLEVTTGEPLNHTVESLGPIKFLDPSNSLILYFIKNTTLAVNNPTTLLTLPGLPYITSIITKFNKTPAQIPLHYHNFLNIFGETKTNTLPPYRPYVDYAINLVPR